MMNEMSRANWHAITPSPYPWEKEAFDYIQSQFPAHEPYRAWANFEFIADDGSLNEVDLLVFTPQGFFLVEIKSTPAFSPATPTPGRGNKMAARRFLTTRSFWPT